MQVVGRSTACWFLILLILHGRISSTVSTFIVTNKGTRSVGLNGSTTGQGEMRQVLFRGPLFGRLTKAGRDYLLKNGWSVLEDATAFTTVKEERLGFVWPTKTGPQFEIHDESAAHIRPFPKHMTDIFDDKLQLAQALKGTSLAPPCLEQPLVPERINSESLYFVKHRYGAQGKSVYVYNHEELLSWQERSQNPHDFIIQHEILPALYEGRKFVLRCHILLVQRADSHTGNVEAFVHKSSIICQHHARVYQEGISEKSSQVSQAGKKHPAPILLQDLPPDHPCTKAYDRIFQYCQNLCGSVKIETSDVIAPQTTCFALLGADLVMDHNRNIKVCEVNSHPALGWGTMSKVPKPVFDGLIQETLSLLLQNNDPEYARSNFDSL